MMSEANRNFYKIAKLVDEDKSVVIMKNNKPKYILLDFYVTNISWVGFSTITKPIKNVNYYDLPKSIQDVIIDNFVYEMKLVNPTHIISCSNKVLHTLTQLKAQNKIDANIQIKLNHPYYCSIKNNTPKEYLKYIETLENFIAE